MNAVETQCFTILTEAASSTFGLVLRTTNAAKARATLYRVRADVGDVTLKSLHIRVSPDNSENELWIIRRQEAPKFDVGNVI